MKTIWAPWRSFFCASLPYWVFKKACGLGETMLKGKRSASSGFEAGDSKGGM